MISNKKSSILLIILFFIMFLFTNKSNAEYDKLIYEFSIESITGDIINFSNYKNKAILLVNVASQCGFTGQYKDLQNLWDKYKKEGLIVIGLPTNQFGNQEPGNNEQIKKFCEVNFNISFPITDKVEVKGENAHQIYLWAKENFGNSAIPKWNFHKILINTEGKIHDTFSSLTKPTSKKIVSEIEKILDIK